MKKSGNFGFQSNEIFQNVPVYIVSAFGKTKSRPPSRAALTLHMGWAASAGGAGTRPAGGLPLAGEASELPHLVEKARAALPGLVGQL